MSSKTNTQAAHCSTMKLEPEGSQNKLESETEHSTIATGLLVIRKSPDIRIQNEIGKIFKGHNLLECKISDKDMDIETFLQSVGYACLYLAYSDSPENISDDITVSLVREKKPKKLFRQLARRGFVVKKTEKGFTGFRDYIFSQSSSSFPTNWTKMNTSGLSHLQGQWKRRMPED